MVTTGKELVPFAVDPFRAIVFPNNIRERRLRTGMPKLLQLAAKLPQIPYVRLSKIERGEVVAKASEILALADTLAARPDDLLIDIGDANFDIRRWAADLQDWEAVDPNEDRFAVMLAAALRARRDEDGSLTIAVLERDFGIAPVILSRLENAQKVLERWNKQTIDVLCRLFGVSDVPGLRAHVLGRHKMGLLDPYLNLIANPVIRIEKGRAKIAALRQELAEGASPIAPKPKTPQPRRSEPFPFADEVYADAPPPSSPAFQVNDVQAPGMAMIRLVPVFGAPLADGLIARIATGETVEAPRRAGLQSYGLRVCRSTLGPGLPARTVVVVDPDCAPSAGGIVVSQEAAGLRLLMVTFDRHGRMIGYSQNPDKEIILDTLDPTALATVIGAVYE